jgi:hypothetical protein
LAICGGVLSGSQFTSRRTVTQFARRAQLGELVDFDRETNRSDGVFRSSPRGWFAFVDYLVTKQEDGHSVCSHMFRAVLPVWALVARGEDRLPRCILGHRRQLLGTGGVRAPKQPAIACAGKLQRCQLHLRRKLSNSDQPGSLCSLAAVPRLAFGSLAQCASSPYWRRQIACAGNVIRRLIASALVCIRLKYLTRAHGKAIAALQLHSQANVIRRLIARAGRLQRESPRHPCKPREFWSAGHKCVTFEGCIYVLASPLPANRTLGLKPCISRAHSRMAISGSLAEPRTC